MFPKVVYTDDVTVINAQNLNDIQDAIIQHDAKADQDGYYEDMTVGMAEELVGTTFTEDDTPYQIRKSGGGVEVGAREYLDKLVGGSLGWNQLNNYGQNSGSNNGVTYTKTASGWTVSGTATSPNQSQYRTTTDIPCVSGHRYLCIANAVLSPDGLYVIIWRNNSATRAATIGQNAAEKLVMFTGGSDWTNLNIWFHVAAGKTASNTNLVVNLFDLTAMFGSTIADYIYSLESATAGAGVAWLRRYIDIDTYHAYDAGSIQSVQATAHVTKDADDNVIGTYPLGSDTLRGTPQLASNKLQFDGDEKYPDGTIKRKYGIVDLGSLTWTYQSNTGMFYSGGYADMKAGTIKGIVSNGYKLVSRTSTVQSTDKTICKDTNGRLYAHDSAYSTTAAFQTAISGTYMVYEKNSETTESSTAYQKIQTINKDGTEQFVCSSPVPVGHYTQYPKDLWSTLDKLADIFVPPTANGTYTLKVTVNNGVATYSWVAG